MAILEYFNTIEKTTLNTCLILLSLTLILEFSTLTEVSMRDSYPQVNLLFIYIKKKLLLCLCRIIMQIVILQS